MKEPMTPEMNRWREEGRAPAGSCPFCASRISVVERDGVFVARCSHRGCGARGPRHHDLTRACDLFCCPPPRTACGMTRAEADRGDGRAARRAAEARAERAEAALASLRHAALFAAGVRGGPGAWRWAHDKRGTILDDVAAWDRLLGEMRERAQPTPTAHVPDGETGPRKPVAGWEVGHVPGYSARRAAPILRRGPICVRAEERGWEMVAESDEDDVESIQITNEPAPSLEAAQLAAEDALFAIADAINALRGGR